MGPDVAIDLMRQAMLTTCVLVGPALGVALVVGCLMSVLQTITQVQDQAISFVPKLIAVGLTLTLLMPWMLQHVVHYVRATFADIPLVGLGQ